MTSNLTLFFRQKQIEKEEEEEKTRRKLSRARDHDDDAEDQVVEEKLRLVSDFTSRRGFQVSLT